VKVCGKCKVLIGLVDFSKCKSRKDGLQSKCKSCVKAYNELNKDKKSEYGKAWYETNKDYCAEYSKAQYATNKTKRKEQSKALHDANKPKRAAQGKLWREANKDEVAEYSKAWDKANPAKRTALVAKYRATKANATPKWLTKEDIKDIEQFYIDAKRLESSTGIPHHVDHIIPLQGDNVCGLHVPLNLQVLTASENTSKSNKFSDWN